MKKVFILLFMVMTGFKLYAQSYNWAYNFHSQNLELPVWLTTHAKFTLAAQYKNAVYVFINDTFEQHNLKSNRVMRHAGLVKFKDSLLAKSNYGIYSLDSMNINSVVVNPIKTTINVFITVKASITIGNQKFDPVKNGYPYKLLRLEYDTNCVFKSYELISESKLISTNENYIQVKYDWYGDLICKLNGRCQTRFVKDGKTYMDKDSFFLLKINVQDGSILWHKKFLSKSTLSIDADNIIIDKKNSFYFVTKDSLYTVNYMDGAGNIIKQFRMPYLSFNLLNFNLNENDLWISGIFDVGESITLKDSSFKTKANSMLLLRVNLSTMKIAWFTTTEGMPVTGMVVNNDGKLMLGLMDLFQSLSFKLGNDTVIKSNGSGASTNAGYIAYLSREGKLLFTRPYCNIRKAPWPTFIKNDCGMIYIIDTYHTCLYNCPSSMDSVFFDSMHYAANAYGNDFFIAEINPEKLDFEMRATCEGIYATNTSSDAYTDIKWLLPSGELIHGQETLIRNRNYKQGNIRMIATNSSGCIYSKSKVLIPLSKTSVIAKFSTDSFSGCQWVGIKFKDSSTMDTVNKIIGEHWQWDFGDGNTDTLKNPTHIYSKEGGYTVRLIYTNGFCTDTFSLSQMIHIISAPKPGFNLNDTFGCAPFTAVITDRSSGQCVAWKYTAGSVTSDKPNTVFVLNKPGIYTIRQELTGPTGCVTTDSALIRVSEGITNDTVTRINFVSVKQDDNTVYGSFRLHTNAAHYTLLSSKDGVHFNPITTENDSNFNDKSADATRSAYYYKLKVYDSCGNEKESQISKTMYLQLSDATNLFRNLYWNSYVGWPQGVKQYNILRGHSPDLVKAYETHNTVFEDNDELDSREYDSVCYAIRADSKGTDTSLSNRQCYLYQPQVFIPNAFTPNEDGFNDSFKISSLGIKEFNIKIYNRWGELVFSGNKEQSWDGKFRGENCMDDVYIYYINAIANNSRRLNYKGTFTLFR